MAKYVKKGKQWVKIETEIKTVKEPPVEKPKAKKAATPKEGGE